jgi:hypothetical protein
MGIQLTTAFAIEFPVSTPLGKNPSPAVNSLIRGKSRHQKLPLTSSHEKTEHHHSVAEFGFQ